jgi:uncharacterized membrane protein YphA (DoxX/SURF4 family)
MNLRTWSRVLLAVAFSVSGLAETLGATGLVVELSPDGLWGSGVHTLAVSGPLQLVGAVLLATGRKTRWTLSILGGYLLLVSVFGNLPLIFHPQVGGSAIAGLLIDLAILGGILYVLYGLHSDRTPDSNRAKPALPVINPAPALPIRLLARPDSSDPQTPATHPLTRRTAALPRPFGSSHRINCVSINEQHLGRASGIAPGATGFHSPQPPGRTIFRRAEAAQRWSHEGLRRGGRPAGLRPAPGELAVHSCSRRLHPGPRMRSWAEVFRIPDPHR